MRQESAHSIVLDQKPPHLTEVDLVNPLEIPDWDNQLTKLPGATFFHCAAWARVLNGTYGYNPVYLVTKGKDGMNSLLPIMEVKSWLTGNRGVSLPFTDDCEPLGIEPNFARRLFEQAIDCAKKRYWKYFECRGGRTSFGDIPPSSSYFNHQLTLMADEAALFAKFDGAVRRAIRKAESQEVVVEFFQSMEAVQTFYSLFCKTRQRHAIPPQPFAFFENIQRYVLAQNQGWVVLARRGQQTIAGAVFFHFGKTIIYKFGASDPTFQHLRANNLIMWETIRRCAREGFTLFDFGRTSVQNKGLRRFKHSWGTRERMIDYISFNLKTGRFNKHVNSSAMLLLPAYKLMPLFASRMIGFLLYKHIALLSLTFDWKKLGNCF